MARTTGSLNVLRRQLSKEQRDQLMRDMRADGMSYRAIAEAVGVSAPTVMSTVKNLTDEQPEYVMSRDGRMRPAQQAPKPEPIPTMFEPGESVALEPKAAKAQLSKAANERKEGKQAEKAKRKQEILDKYDDVTEWDGELANNTISQASIYDLELPAESVDMIFTDPPYHDEYVGLYSRLGEVANHVLKPGGYMMAYAGKMFIPDVIRSLEQYLEYVSMCAVFQSYSKSKIQKHNLFENWRPIVAFKKPGKTAVREWTQDVVRGTRDKSHHDWQQDSEAPLQYIEAYTRAGDIVLDPFVGGGTTPWACKQLGRYYVAFDVDEDAVKLSMERLSHE